MKTPNIDIIPELAKLHRYLSDKIQTHNKQCQHVLTELMDIKLKLEAIMERLR